MITGEIIVKGKSPDKKIIKKLIDLCNESSVKLDTEDVVLVLDNEVHMSADCQNYAVPSTNKAYRGRALTYSEADNNADVMTLNLQSYENKKSFELLSGWEMSRIYMNKESEFSSYSVLCVASALIAGKATVKNVVELFNSILK